MNVTYPHCDTRVLHAPGECEYCDQCPDAQAQRIQCGVAFSGHEPEGDEIPCPADAAVANGERGDYNRWPGNTPEGYPPLVKVHDVPLGWECSLPETHEGPCAARPTGWLHRLYWAWKLR